MTLEVPEVSYFQVERKKKIRDPSLKKTEHFTVVTESITNSILHKGVEPTP